MGHDSQHEFLFTLSKLTTEQFAIFEDNYKKDGELEMSLKSEFGADPINRKLGMFLQFQLRMEETQKEVLIIESGLHFQIEKKSWENCIDKNKNTLTIPHEYIYHFATIAIGATRGMLHAKTEGTQVNHLFLPLMTADKIIDAKDLVVRFKNKSNKKIK